MFASVCALYFFDHVFIHHSPSLCREYICVVKIPFIADSPLPLHPSTAGNSSDIVCADANKLSLPIERPE